ncbi:hypothetical protein PM082_017166 [Marasmius tenuissimus]|nr:hypothetical protein PM082_017166 [Marasmius tenuissimus]
MQLGPLHPLPSQLHNPFVFRWTPRVPKFNAIHWDQFLHVPWSPSNISWSDFTQTPCSDVESPSGENLERDDLNGLNSLLSPAVLSSDYARTRRPQQAYVDVPEQSHILNIILHVAYGLSVDPYAPTFEMLSQALDRLPIYGIEPKIATTSLSAFHSTLMTHAPTTPIELYILASKHDCFDLAASVSPFLLSYRVENMTDTTAKSIGPVYLARLFSLQRKRLAALGEIMSTQPHSHLPTRMCNVKGERMVARAWTLASAYLLWEGRPDITPSQVDSALRSLPAHASCPLCKQGLNDRIDIVVNNWKETIVSRGIPKTVLFSFLGLVWTSHTDTLVETLWFLGLSTD